MIKKIGLLCIIAIAVFWYNGNHKPLPTSISNILNSDQVKSSNEFDKLVLPFYQDTSNAPDYVTDLDFVAAINLVNQKWGQACNVQFKYLGKLNRDYTRRVPKGAGLVQWGDFKEPSYLGETTAGSAEGPMTEFRMTLSRRSFLGYMDLFRATVLHEFGHVIGLDHSNNSKSVMYATIDINQKDYGDLNTSDKAACRYFRYRWEGYTPEQASEKAGIVVDE